MPLCPPKYGTISDLSPAIDTIDAPSGFSFARPVSSGVRIVKDSTLDEDCLLIDAVSVVTG